MQISSNKLLWTGLALVVVTPVFHLPSLIAVVGAVVLVVGVVALLFE